MENSIRSSAITRKMPTPQATARISTILGTDGTSSARTCRSGSDMVIINPSKKPRITVTARFLLFVRQVPTRSPIMDMDISAPRVKNIIPTTSRTAPARKQSRMLGDMGAIQKHKTRTIPIIGRTA